MLCYMVLTGAIEGQLSYWDAAESVQLALFTVVYQATASKTRSGGNEKYNIEGGRILLTCISWAHR